MRGLVLLLAAACFVLAGCAGTSLPADSKGRDVPVMPAELIPGDRPVGANVTYRATLHDELAESQPDSFRVHAKPWEPYDLELTYHGIQEVHDEWGHIVPALVFRSLEMVFVTDDVQIDPSGVEISGHYEPRVHESQFDLADARLTGVVDLKGEDHYFSGPEYLGPLGSPVLFGMLPWAMEQLGVDELPLVDYSPLLRAWVSVEPYDGPRPLEGECDMLQVTGRVEPEPEVSIPAPPTPDPYRLLLCRDDATAFPLWMRFGNSTSHVRYERLTASKEIDGLEGERLAPLEHPRLPWQPTAEIPVVGPLMVPPEGSELDWAAHIRARADALRLSPGYITFRATHDGAFLDMAITGWPDVGQLLGPQPLVPALYDEMSWLFAQSGPRSVPLPTVAEYTTYWGDVFTKDLGGERGEIHVADVRGSEFESFVFGEAPDPDNLPPIPTIADVQAAASDLLVPEPSKIDFWYVGDIGLPNHLGLWMATNACFKDPEPTDRYSIVDMSRGYVMMAGRPTTERNGCSIPGEAAATPAGTLVQADDGTLALLLGDGTALVRLGGETLRLPVHGLPDGALLPGQRLPAAQLLPAASLIPAAA